MPSDNSAGVKMLVRDNPLSEDEWINLIELRRGMIKPFLDKITLQRLGDVERYFYHEKLEDLLKRVRRFDPAPDNRIKIQGFFEPLNPGDFSDSSYKDVYRFYGLSRDNQWLYVRVICPSSGNGCKFVVVEIPSTKMLLKKTRIKPRGLWLDLGKFFGQAVKDRKTLMEDMEHVLLVMNIEKSVEILLPR